MAVTSDAALIRIAAVVGFTVLACNKSAPESTDLPDLDDIAAYEQELAANAARLDSAGIHVARRDTTVDHARLADPAPTASPGPAPVAPPSEPASEPAPEPAPQIAPELEADAGGEADLDEEPLSEDDAPMLTSRPAEREMVSEAAPADAEMSRGMYRRRGRARRARAERRAVAGRCERVCDLAESSCQLEDRICGLAERHRGEPRYEQACLRAEDQCDAAAQACRACS